MNASPEQYREQLQPQRTAPPSMSCVVPAYNEAGNLPTLLSQLTAQLAALTPRWEIIVVDDGSSDATFGVMIGLTRTDGIRYVRLSRNFGKEAALTAGIARAQGQVVILIDADLQHPVALIPTMLEQWRQGYDCVYAVRQSRHEESFIKRFGTRLLYLLMNAGSKMRVPENAGDYRLLDRAAVDALLALPERNRFMKGLYAWVGFNATGVPFTPEARAAGKSHFSLRRLSSLGLTGLTAFSYLPLRVWSGVGVIIALLAFAYGTYVTIEKLIYGNDVPGWPTVVAAIMFFNGILLLSIGILGEYIGRIYEEVKQRPLYVIAGEFGNTQIRSGASAQG
jgi:glycosyltransferase involved in cell wall biosynthesis